VSILWVGYPSPLSDASSVSANEAIACGVAPVVTNVSENERWIRNGENGYIVPTKRQRMLAERISYLLKNDTARRRIAASNRGLVEVNFNYEKEMTRMESLYEELIEK
jgi:glycosyltransferase involved in cell wall biosynthesis